MFRFHPHAQRQQGFSLIELAIVLLVVGLLLGTVMMPLATQFRIRETRDAQQQIEEVRQALIGFAQSRGRLPCPDTDRDGLENPPPPIAVPPADCTNVIGTLPYATVGLSATDPWGQLYTYRVALEFTKTTVPGASCAVADNQLGLCDNGNITVVTRGDDTTTSPAIEAKNLNNYTTSAAAILISHGHNGYCGTRPDGTQIPPLTGTCPTSGAATTDEFENSDTDDSTFVFRPFSGGGTGCSDSVEGSIFCEFDDLVVWIPSSLLLGKLIEAGQLP